MNETAEIVLYQPNETVHLEVRLENESVWLNRQQLSILFERDIKTIGKHINNALKEELSNIPTVANFATVGMEGSRVVTRQIEYYNLDMILSVGYRVKSNRGIEFRRWANTVLKEYLLKGYALNHRIQRLDERLSVHEQRLNQIDNKIEFFVHSSLPPVEGVFYNGQIFDAYKFASDLIRSAKQSIILVDNYVDESVLMILSKRSNNVSATILTSSISRQFQLDIDKYNSQYEPIIIKRYKDSHDRFLIIDGIDVYHIGASLKDLGKKLFAFSKLNIDAGVFLALLVNETHS